MVVEGNPEITFQELVFYPRTKTQLFNRFVKHPKYSESTGLGLAIVKQIAEQYGLKITYKFDEMKQVHTFIMKW
jgi:K+-sensing histidine kinase KdpD